MTSGVFYSKAQIDTLRATDAATYAPVLSTVATQTAPYIANPNEIVPCDSTAYPFTVTLPTAPADKTQVRVKLVTSTTPVNAVTVALGGSDKINTVAGPSSTTLTLLNQAVTFQYNAGSSVWLVVGDDLPLSQLDGRYAPTVSPHFTGMFGIGGAPGNAGIPFALDNTINGPAAVATGTTDVVGTQFNNTFVGDFTGMGGADPGFIFGGDHYTVVGDVTGVNSVEGWIGEVSITKPSGHINTVIGTEAGISFDQPGNVTVGVGASLIVADPCRQRNGSSGTIQNAYGVMINAVTGGTTSSFSLFVAGGISRFMGRVDVYNNITNGGGSNFDLNGAFAATDAASLSLQSTANGGHVQATVPNASAFLFVTQNGGGLGFAANGQGVVGIGGYPDAGGAAGPVVNIKNLTTAPAGNPTAGGILYVQAGALKFRGSSGTVTTIAVA